MVDWSRPAGLSDVPPVQRVAQPENWAVFGGPEHEPVDPKELRKIQIEIRRSIPADKVALIYIIIII